ncbi:hypothetical protein K505DRAFT_326910 [Melanomma pulvis-pyrius CBS 109.77]|uniref:Uncharacterized protein n=1 Tax=Melanomma pulvis-pyrius CBS 109.77 TaxID=1314802 RepID=A0A6A6X539_9PLEO|nr:hypothetical protein K505DRAFT_326910 [Melanomma pulvis-pyrius CBS 109.77]
MADSSTITNSAVDGARNENGLRKALRRWREKLKRDPHTKSSTPSSTRPHTPAQPPIPIPAILFTPTTQTIISSPADPRNSPPTTLKKLRLARRNTAPAGYFATTGTTASAPAIRNASPNRHAGASRNASPNARVYVPPVNTVTTTITATNPQALRTRRSRLRLSFSSRAPIVETRPGAPLAGSRSSSAHRPAHASSNSTSMVRSVVGVRAPSPKPDGRRTVDTKKDQPPDTEPASKLSGFEERQNTAQRHATSQNEKETEKMVSTVEIIRRDKPKEERPPCTKLHKNQDQAKEEKKLERRRREEEVLRRAGKMQVGMMV